ncbi:MAG: ABC transporter ATP-binding protein/permease [Lentisphaeria bacterium]|nr:ABC transporter ATP-binding protein/permease [Lentisphaeria bacterium]
MDFLKTTLFRLPFCREFRRFAYAILFAEFLLAGLACLMPLMQKQLVDNALNGERSKVVLTCVAVALLAVASFAISLGVRRCKGVMHAHVTKEAKGTVFRCLLALPENFLQERGSGYFFNRVQHDTGEVVSFICNGGISVWNDMVRLVISLGMVYWMDWRVGAFVTVCLLPQAFVCRYFQQCQREISKTLHECTASQRQVMQEYLENHRLMNTHDYAAPAESRLRKGFDQWSDLYLKRIANENRFAFWIQISTWMCTGVVILGGFYLVGLEMVKISSLWAGICLIRIVFTPAKNLAFFFVPAASAQTSWLRIQELVKNATVQDTEDDAAETTPVPEGDIVLDNVTFGYATDAKTLQNFSMTVPLGSLRYLMGPNGCGKSTVLALLLKLYAPESGRILAGGTDLSGIPTRAWRRNIGYLGQKPPFVRGTLRENLMLGNNAGTPMEDSVLMAALQAAGCDSILEHHAGGLDVQITMNGDNLSGGERLRVALARELLRNTTILLLDEPAAALDSDGRQQFYAQLETLVGKKTILAVVHDLPGGHDDDVILMHPAECS